jgi:hypothetical protein
MVSLRRPTKTQAQTIRPRMTRTLPRQTSALCALRARGTSSYSRVVTWWSAGTARWGWWSLEQAARSLGEMRARARMPAVELQAVPALELELELELAPVPLLPAELRLPPPSLAELPPADASAARRRRRDGTAPSAVSLTLPSSGSPSPRMPSRTVRPRRPGWPRALRQSEARGPRRPCTARRVARRSRKGRRGCWRG